jgi:hypothetical protein
VGTGAAVAYRVRRPNEKGGDMVKRLMISQLTSMSEGAITKLASSEMRQKAFQGALQMKERVERMMSAMNELDTRVTALEQRVEALEKPKRRAPARSASSKAATKPAAKTTRSRSSSSKSTSS